MDFKELFIAFLIIFSEIFVIYVSKNSLLAIVVMVMVLSFS